MAVRWLEVHCRAQVAAARGEWGPGIPRELGPSPQPSPRRGEEAAGAPLSRLEAPTASVVASARHPRSQARTPLPQLPSARGIAAAAPLRARGWLGKAQRHLALMRPRAEQAVSFGYFSLLRASCPSPFGPASLFARAPGAGVGQQRKVTRAPSGDRKPAAGEPSRGRTPARTANKATAKRLPASPGPSPQPSPRRGRGSQGAPSSPLQPADFGLSFGQAIGSPPLARQVAEASRTAYKAA
jgi:hypothetical protein